MVAELLRLCGGLLQLRGKLCPSFIIKVRMDNKAPGPDSIEDLALKKLPGVIIDVLIKIVNAVLSLVQFLSQWEMVDVVTVLKVNKTRELTGSYRPVYNIFEIWLTFAKVAYMMNIRDLAFLYSYFSNNNYNLI